MEIKDIYKGGLVLLLGFIFLKIGGVLFRIICMRFLPVESYGEVALFLVLFNWFVLFATLNVTIGLAKFVSQEKAKKELHFASAFWGTLLLSLVVSIILYSLSPVIAQYTNVSLGVIWLAVLCAPFAAIYNVGIFYLRGNYRMGSSTKVDAFMMVVRIAALTALLYAGIAYAPYAAFIGSFVLVDVYILARNRGLTGFSLPEVLSGFRTLLIYSIPVFASEFLRTFSMGIDRIALAGFYSTAEAGIYDVAVALCLGYVIIANSYSNALLPIASSHHADGKKRRMALRKALKASSVLFALYTVLILAAGGPVVEFINPAYSGAVELLLPLSAAYIIIGFLTILYFFANSVGLQRYALYSGACFAFLSVTLNFYLVPSMVYMGAVYALMGSAAFSLGILGALIWKSERLS